ncbi:MAG: hypothetical protein C5B50_13000 [Verrucomicrobia bacterium]|nr:MAG: hypothetical protein C5B50_13000 [Verrucomicrobiota bacterium]
MIYADTGFLVSLNVHSDAHSAPALKFYETNQDRIWLWSPWHRVELFNTLRQLTRDNAKPFTVGEAKGVIHEIEADVRVGYFTHKEADWRDVLRKANEISAASAFNHPCRSADLLHVAYAVELSAQLFVSYDRDQLALAKAAGLQTQSP